MVSFSQISLVLFAGVFAVSWSEATGFVVRHGNSLAPPRRNATDTKKNPSGLKSKQGKELGNVPLLEDSSEKLDATTKAIRIALDFLRDSPLIDEKHAEHCESPTVTHLFKETPLVGLPDELKLKFVDSWAGKMLATVMAEEQNYLGDWKIDKILDAAGDYNSSKVLDRILSETRSAPIVVYSFVDCPWCIAAKRLLVSAPYDAFPANFVELEDCGVVGKHIRAELAKMTGRTSMPCIFVRGKPIGGFTDGDPCGPGLKELHETGELLSLLRG